MPFRTDLDTTPRYAPNRVIVATPCGFTEAPVTSYHAYPPGHHPKTCPLVRDCTALELRTPHGSRWFGCSEARINSELRMVVVGTPRRDEVRMSWQVATIS